MTLKRRYIFDDSYGKRNHPVPVEQKTIISHGNRFLVLKDGKIINLILMQKDTQN